MEFEQAIYTRGTGLLYETGIGIGLGIVAASRNEREFVESCRRIGSNFKSEWSEQTAQFAIYDNKLDTYVGVGISPAVNRDGGGANFLCHIFVPVKDEGNQEVFNRPEKYYIDYPFIKTPVKRSRLDRVDLSSFQGISEGNYRRILEKYHLDSKRLAYFLYKIFPVMFMEKNLLLIVIDEEQWGEKEHPDIAKEMTGLANYLAPGEQDSGLAYRKRLSYSVHAKRNIFVANIAYSSDEDLYTENRFYLGREPDETAPEIYSYLAQKALESLSAYKCALCEILDNKIENISSRKLYEGFFRWKLDTGKRVVKNEIPYQMDTMIKMAKDDPKDGEMFIKYILQADDLTIRDLRIIWKEFLVPELAHESKLDKIQDSAERLLVQIYEKNKKWYYRILWTIPKDPRSNIIKDLYSQNEAYIRGHFEEIQTFEEYWDAIELYSCLNGNKQYEEFVKQLDIAKMIPEQIRDFVLLCFKDSDMDTEARSQIRKYIWSCKLDIPSKLFCSWAFDLQQYSIWEDITIGDIGQYEKVKAAIEDTPHLHKIENEPLKDKRNRKAEWNRGCYCFWKQFSESEDNDLSDIYQDTLDFLNYLTDFIMEKLDLKQENLEQSNVEEKKLMRTVQELKKKVSRIERRVREIEDVLQKMGKEQEQSDPSTDYQDAEKVPEYLTPNPEWYK